MGYSQYWDRAPSVITDDAVSDIKAIIKQAKKRGIVIAGPLGDGAPEISSDRIFFNGSSKLDEDYETFGLDTSAAERWNFVKTGERPYDAVVCAVLLRLNDDTDIGVSSDGKWGDDMWQDAASLYQDAMGKAASKPDQLDTAPGYYQGSAQALPVVGAKSASGAVRGIKNACAKLMPRAKRSCVLPQGHAAACK